MISTSTIDRLILDLSKELKINIENYGKDHFEDKQDLDNLVEKSSKLYAKIEILNLLKGLCNGKNV